MKIQRLHPAAGGILGFLLSLTVADPGLSQDEAAPTLSPGSRVRVTSSLLDDRVVGRLSAITGTHIVLDPAGYDPELRLPLASLTKLERSDGMGDYKMLGAGLGLGAGFVASIPVVLASSASECGDGDWSRLCEAGKTAEVLSLVVFPVAGALVGGFIGSLVERELWVDAYVPRIEPIVSFWPGRNQASAITFGLRLRI